MKHTDVQRIPLQVSQGCVVASIQIDLTEEILTQFRKDLLDCLYETGAKGLILDLSGVEVMDSEDFQALNKTLSMASLMGAKAILTGFQPGVVSSLVDLNVEIDHINATLNLDAAFDLMKHLNGESADNLEEEEKENVAEKFEEELEENGTAQISLDWS